MFGALRRFSCLYASSLTQIFVHHRTTFLTHIYIASSVMSPTIVLPSIPSHLDAVLQGTTVDDNALGKLTREEVKMIKPYISDLFLFDLQPGHLLRFTRAIPLPKARLEPIQCARILHYGGMDISRQTLKEVFRCGRCGFEHRCQTGKQDYNRMSIFEQVGFMLNLKDSALNP